MIKGTAAVTAMKKKVSKCKGTTEVLGCSYLISSPRADEFCNFWRCCSARNALMGISFNEFSSRMFKLLRFYQYVQGNLEVAGIG
jgi:hypothetical protein